MTHDKPIRAAGWLHDPTRHHQIRYWDGHRWTAQVSDNGQRAIDELCDQPAPPVRPEGARVVDHIWADAVARFGAGETPTFKVNPPTVRAG